MNVQDMCIDNFETLQKIDLPLAYKSILYILDKYNQASQESLKNLQVGLSHY